MTSTGYATEIDAMYQRLQEKHDLNGYDLAVRLNVLTTDLARSAVIVGEAKQLLEAARGEAAESLVGKDIPPSLAKDIIAKRTASEGKLFMQADRLNSAIVHTIDAVRTLLSYEKMVNPGNMS